MLSWQGSSTSVMALLCQLLLLCFVWDKKQEFQIFTWCMCNRLGKEQAGIHFKEQAGHEEIGEDRIEVMIRTLNRDRGASSQSWDWQGQSLLDSSAREWKDEDV